MENKSISVDGELFIGENTPPPPRSRELPKENELWREQQAYHLENDTRGETTLYERVLFRTKDPTSLPNTRKKCVKWCRTDIPPIKVCCGWKLQYKWLYVSCELKVTTSVATDIGKEVEKCLQESVVVSAITAILTGGSGAIAAAEATFKACLLRKLGEKLLSVNLALHHRRGPWE